MKLNKIDTFLQYERLIMEFSAGKLFSNDYIQAEAADLITHDRLYEAHTASNLFLFVEKSFGRRMYYYIGNIEEIADFSDNENIVTEIIYRGPKFYPEAEIEYLKRCGLSVNLVRDQYCGVYPELTIPHEAETTEVSIAPAHTIAAVRWASELFNTSFDSLSGDFISELEYEWLLENQAILIAKDPSGKLLGALHQEVNKGVAWINHIAVLPDCRGKHVGRSLLSAFITNNHHIERQRYMFWVQHQNTVAINMYEGVGFKYMNRSTISLVKY